MFTTDTLRCPTIDVNCSDSSGSADARPEPGVCVQQSKRVSHALLHGKSPVGANGACRIYVGGVTIWLVRHCAPAVVTRCPNEKNSIHCP